MCGIAGIVHPSKAYPIEQEILNKMIHTLRHRGPDDFGFYKSGGVGLAQSRLSIIDLDGGKQPIFNEDKTIAVVFNGEIFNYIELGELLRKKGHRFYTQSDTEVIVHAYEEFGLDFVHHLNGQFAIAIWDDKKHRLLLARDRVGIRPLFYTHLSNGEFLFASEMKALFEHPDVESEIDPSGLNQIFTLWVNIPPKTVFKNIEELAPGHLMTIQQGKRTIRKYWTLSYPRQNDYNYKPIEYYSEKLKELLYDAVTLRLRADVPVATYLSGGIDSSITTALVKKYHNNNLITFSVAFQDAGYDERKYQQEMVAFLQTDHRMVETDYNKIGHYFSDVVWFAEKPMIRTAPAPLYILSGLVRKDNIKVVLTGEGADEVLGGYNIFREDKVRRFWAKYPESRMRPLLLSRLYPYIQQNRQQGQNFWQLFFKKNLQDTENPYYSHLLRWSNTAQVKKFFNEEFRNEMGGEERILNELSDCVDNDMMQWHPLSRAQYLEMSLFMPGYLLSSQGDRMMMGHSVEGRFPYLDHRLVEFANAIPPEYKIKVLDEKYILKKTYRDLIPSSIIEREKQPYRAPISQCFVPHNGSSASDMLEDSKLDQYGYFNTKAVKRLVAKAEQSGGKPMAARDDMALVGIVSTQLLHNQFVKK